MIRVSLDARNVLIVDHETLVRRIVSKFETFTKSEEKPSPLFIWGPSGCGKSDSVYNAAKILAKKYDRTFVVNDYTKADGEHFVLLDFRLAHELPENIGGVTWPDHERGIMKKLAPEFLYYLSKKREEEIGEEIMGIIFFDEFDQAPALNQNSAQELIHDRRIGSTFLADKVMIVAAGNGLCEDGYYHTFELPDNIKTRFSNVYLPPPPIKSTDGKDWFHWALEHDVDHRILSFLALRPDLLWSRPQNAKVFPTPRGWFKASLEIKDLDDEEAWIPVAENCGAMAGTLFKEFLNLRSKVSVDEVLNDPEKFLTLVDEEKGRDVQFALAPAIAHTFANDPTSRYKVIHLIVSVFVGSTDPQQIAEYAKKVLQAISSRDPVPPPPSNYSNHELVSLLLHLCIAHASRDAVDKALNEYPYSSALLPILKYVI